MDLATSSDIGNIQNKIVMTRIYQNSNKSMRKKKMIHWKIEKMTEGTSHTQNLKAISI